jgi:DNA repair ATPase RecN
MHGDSVHAVVRVTDAWKTRVEALKTSATRVQTRRDSLVQQRDKTAREITVLSERVEKLSKTGELLRLLMDKLVMDQVKAIESIVTEGLKSIFFDIDLSFQAEVGQSRGKVSIDLLVKRTQNDIEIVGPPLETTGGGVSSIASLTLRLLALMRLKKFPVLFLDETLSAVSDYYVDQTGQFLRKLSETTNIPILLVTHNQAFLDHAKSAYQGFEEQSSDTTWSLGLKRLRGPK